MRLCVCVCESTLSGRLVVSWVEGGGESRRRVRDVSVEVAASAAVRQHSDAQHQYHAQQQGPHQTSVDGHARTRGQRWKEGQEGLTVKKTSKKPKRCKKKTRADTNVRGERTKGRKTLFKTHHPI